MGAAEDLAKRKDMETALGRLLDGRVYSRRGLFGKVEKWQTRILERLEQRGDISSERKPGKPRMYRMTAGGGLGLYRRDEQELLRLLFPTRMPKKKSAAPPDFDNSALGPLRGDNYLSGEEYLRFDRERDKARLASLVNSGRVRPTPDAIDPEYEIATDDNALDLTGEALQTAQIKMLAGLAQLVAQVEQRLVEMEQRLSAIEQESKAAHEILKELM